MTIKKVTEYTGNVADPYGSQSQAEFTQNAFDQFGYLKDFSPDLNSTIGEMNAAITSIEQSEANAAGSAAAAEAAALGGDYKGLWPDVGGSALKGEVYQTQSGGTPTGDYFTALQNTSVAPLDDNVNWRVLISSSYVDNKVKSVRVSQYRLAPDIDWSNAIIRAMAVGTGTIEFDELPVGGKYDHSSTISFYTDIIGAGTVIYTGTGDAYTPSESISVSGVRFESDGNDTSMWHITNSLGIKFIGGTHTTGGNYNLLVNGVASQLSVDDGASFSYARADNVKIIQAKRSSISINSFIYGAAGWGVNIDSTTATAPDQMHGIIVEPQLWGNAAGGIRCVGKNTAGDGSDWVQHPTLGGHVDHNSNDIDPSVGIYVRNVQRPVFSAVMIRAHKGYGMDIDNVNFPVIANKAYWKNDTGDFLIGPEVTGWSIMPYSGDFNGVNNSNYPGSEYGRECKTFGNITSGGGIYNFAELGFLKQFQSGAGAGHAELDLNSDLTSRKLTIRNKASIDARLIVEGHIGSRVFNGAAPGTVTKHAQWYDENGNHIGYVDIKGI